MLLKQVTVAILSFSGLGLTAPLPGAEVPNGIRALDWDVKHVPEPGRFAKRTVSEWDVKHVPEPGRFARDAGIRENEGAGEPEIFARRGENWDVKHVPEPGRFARAEDVDVEDLSEAGGIEKRKDMLMGFSGN